MDTLAGEVLHTDEVDNRRKSRHPYVMAEAERLRIRAPWMIAMRPTEFWLRNTAGIHEDVQVSWSATRYCARSANSREAVGYGDDPHGCAVRPGAFGLTTSASSCQVTNPAIDRCAGGGDVTNLSGCQRNVFETPDHANRAILSSPVVSRPSGGR